MKTVFLIISTFFLIAFKPHSGAVVAESSHFDTLSYENIEINCTQTKDGTYIIRTEDEYQSVLQIKSPHPYCQSYKLPQIDFSKYTLLGISTSRYRCVVKKINQYILKDEQNNLVQFNLNIDEDGICRDVFKIDKWCLIPKVESPIRIEFKINSTNEIK